MKSEQNLYVAFDLGTSQMRGAIGMKDEGGRVTMLACESERSDNAIKRGCIKNISQVAFAVKKLKNKLENVYAKHANEQAQGEEEDGNQPEFHKYTITQAYVGINGNSFRTTETSVKRSLGAEGEIITKEMMEMLNKEALESKVENAEVFEAVPYRYIIDDEDENACPIGVSASHIVVKYKLIVGDPKLKANIKRCFSDAGISIAGFIMSPLAVTNVVSLPEGRELGTMVLDFGSGTTSATIYKESKLIHSVVIPFGGNCITEDIKKELNLTTEISETLKKHGSTMPSAVDGDLTYSITCNGIDRNISAYMLSNIIEARIDELLAYIDKVIGDNPELGNVSQILITGNGAKLNNLKEKIEYMLGIDCDYGLIRSNVSEVSLEQCGKSLNFTQIIGLLSFCDENCISESIPSIEMEQTEAPRSKKEKKASITEGISKGLDRIVGFFGASD